MSLRILFENKFGSTRLVVESSLNGAYNLKVYQKEIDHFGTEYWKYDHHIPYEDQKIILEVLDGK